MPGRLHSLERGIGGPGGHAVRAAGCAALLVFLAAVGCAARKGELRAPAPAAAPGGARVAVAPMENRSNDLDASEIIRRAFVEELGRRGWNVMPTAESDRILREALGINYGGQLSAVTPEEVCAALGVDAVFYGDVLEWNKTTVGIYNAVAVEAKFRLFGSGGALLWEGGDRQFKQLVPGGGGRDVGGQIVGLAVANLFFNPMTPYGKKVGRNIAAKIPAALAAGVAGGNR